jgi:hypothetical protein
VKVKLKAWVHREDIESELLLLREHVQLCYSRFTVRFTESPLLLITQIISRRIRPFVRNIHSLYTELSSGSAWTKFMLW